jgi:uncharacterized protein YbjT (DUF2867 family)
MLLLTGATGQVGEALLGRLLEEGETVRCLVRDPRRLGARRVRVQIVMGDLGDPRSFRNAMRGVDTVVHLAGPKRDQRKGSIEETVGIGTWRLVQAAERAGAGRFLFLSTLGARKSSGARYLRAKAFAEEAVEEAGEAHVAGGAGMETTVFAPSLVYSEGDRRLKAIERLAAAPVVPMSGNGRAKYQPICAADAAECIAGALKGEGSGGAPGADGGGRKSRFELAGPETLSHEEIVRLVVRATGRRRPTGHVPTAIVAAALRTAERAMGGRTPVTAEEAELMEVPKVSKNGTADAELLGVKPRSMGEVLGLAARTERAR